MKIKEHTILVEKYRSDKLENYLCTDSIREKIQEYIDKQDIPHLGLFGQPGSGKTTLAKLLSKNIDCDVLYLNATDNRSMDDIKEKILPFASSNSFKPIKIVILDEATHLLEASQVLLLNIIETFSKKTRFILTGNFPERLIPPLKSRLQEFDLLPPTKPQVAKHIDDILTKEEIEYDVEDLKFLINRFYPDLRKIINTCQQYTLNNKLSLNKSEILNEEEYINKIIDELKKPSSKSFNIIRQYINDSGASEFNNVYKQLYDKLSEYSKGRDGEIIIKIEEYLFHKNFRLDQEINIAACIASILEILLRKQII